MAVANALGGDRLFAGSLGTQVVRVFDLVVAATGVRDGQPSSMALQPATIEVVADEHKAYHLGATPITIRGTGDI